MYKLVIIALLVNLGLCQEFIKESNMWQLDKDSFWKVASRMEVHSVIELYSSDSWCGKYFSGTLDLNTLCLKQF